MMRGFSLVELAVAMAVIGLLIGVLLPTITSQHETRQIQRTQKSLEEIKEALTGYAVTQGRLPCPDTDGDGAENRPLAAPFDCDGYAGELPFGTLGVGFEDAWAQKFQYQVTPEFTYEAIAGMPPGPSRLDLQDVGTLAATVRGADYTSLPAVVWSLNGGDFVIWISRYTLARDLVLAKVLP